VRGTGSLLSKNRKAARQGGFFLFYSISSEYQIEIENRPKLFEGIRVEVEWNEGQHFGTVRGKLDKFCGEPLG
jgi:hypothetical protein